MGAAQRNASATVKRRQTAKALVSGLSCKDSHRSKVTVEVFLDAAEIVCQTSRECKLAVCGGFVFIHH